MRLSTIASGIAASAVLAMSSVVNAMPQPDTVINPLGATVSQKDGINMSATMVQTPEAQVITGAVSTNGADVYSTGQIGSLTAGYGDETAYTAAGASGTQSQRGDTTIEMTVEGSTVEIEDEEL
ncbi:hypothetical protein HC766_01285 [Candidatus Gracilibacteria bacterium]|nr:hypothetical protein [Candidatus Gracilibacteria bacterium]NJS41007.1 hypothetical protein [Candidatus Gracilibacteria bacterium]